MNLLTKSGSGGAPKNILGGLGFLMVVLSFAGCALWPIQEKDVIGTYQTVLEDGTPGLPDGGSEILELKPDHTCTQKIILKDGRTFSAQGTWEWKSYEWYYIRNVIMTGIYWTVVYGDKINPEINPKLEKSLGRIVQSNGVSRDMTGRIILGSTEGVHYEKKR